MMRDRKESGVCGGLVGRPGRNEGRGCVAFVAGGDAGFTLVEIMMSMTVLAVAVGAITMMNYSALSSYTSARDMTEATAVSQKVMSLMQAEAESWPVPRGGGGGVSWKGPTEAIYKGKTSYGDEPILKRLIEKAGDWVAITPLNRAPVTSTAMGYNPQEAGRFCVAGRLLQLPGGMSDDLRVLRIQLAIYYPGSMKIGAGTCGVLVGNDVGSLAASGKPGQVLLEKYGAKVEFFSTVVTPLN